MSDKLVITIGAGLGSTIGGFVPTLWGSGLLSGWSVVLTAIGGILGIYLAYRYVHS